MKPTKWRIEWEALGAIPAGFADYTKRHEARGALIMKRAQGFNATIKPVWS